MVPSIYAISAWSGWWYVAISRLQARIQKQVPTGLKLLRKDQFVDVLGSTPYDFGSRLFLGRVCEVLTAVSTTVNAYSCASGDCSDIERRVTLVDQGF